MVVRLPVVKFRGKRWCLDERLRQLRNVLNPHEWIDLNERELRKFRERRAG